MSDILINHRMGFHQLVGSGIRFKALENTDSTAIHEFASDEDVSRYIGWRLMREPQETQEFVKLMIGREEAGTHLYASIVLGDTIDVAGVDTDAEIIGTAMLFEFDEEANHMELGYVFNKRHWGNGYATEVVKMITQFGFETLGLHKLHARVVGANEASAKVLLKNGYELEGRLKDYYFIDGIYSDGLCLGKINKQEA